MRCDEFRRWLDEGLPPHAPIAGDARAHAGTCAACARALAAAEALEEALRVAPPSPAGADTFVTRVLERIETTAPLEAATRHAPASAGPRPKLWWSLWTEPAFMAGVATLLPILLLPPPLRAVVGHGVTAAVAVAVQSFGAVISDATTASSNALALPPGLPLAARVTLFAGFAVPLLGVGFWFMGAVDRWLRQGTGRRS